MSTRIHLVTPIRTGGPQSWGRELSAQLTQRGWETKHISNLIDVLKVPFYTGCDLLHTTLPLTYRLWKKPTILTIHGNYTIEKTPWSSMYPKAIRMADIVTVTSEFLKNKLNIQHAVVIPPSVHLPELEEKETNVGPLRILMVTKFYFPNKAKGVLQVLQAIAGLKNNIGDIAISIVGGGPYLKYIQEEAAKFHLPVQFYGFCDPKPFLKRADLFLYWSEHDNTPIAILEAMSYSLPVVTNRVGAVAELIKDQESGLIAEDLATFQEYILLLTKQKTLRATIGSAARTSIRDTFSHTKVIPAYENIYRTLIQK